MTLNPRRSPRAARIIAGLVTSTAVLGCSAATIVRPPRPVPPPGQPVNCTRSRAAPWADTILAAAAVAGFVAVSEIDGCQGSGCDLKTMLMVPPALFAVGYAVSALWGHSTVGECRRLQDQGDENAALR